MVCYIFPFLFFHFGNGVSVFFYNFFDNGFNVRMILTNYENVI